MESLNALLTLIGLALLLFTVYLANAVQAAGESESALLHGLLLIVIVFTSSLSAGIVQAALTGDTEAFGRPLPVGAGLLLAALTLALLIGGLGLIGRASWRQRLARWLPGCKADSPVHLTAAVLCLALLVYTIANLVASGGVAGIAEGLAADGIRLSEVVINQVLWVIAALLGVGLWLRRTPSAVAQRLGLRVPTLDDLVWGASVGIGGVVLVLLLGAIGALFSDPAALAEQSAAAQQIAAAFATLPSALVMALTVSIGEEVLFRGALQPIFGVAVTSVFFVALHTQYALTPATFGLLLVTFGFAWLRQQHSTTAAIVAHFVYNFLQLALVIAAARLLENGVP